jgi:hypothetical protein
VLAGPGAAGLGLARRRGLPDTPFYSPFPPNPLQVRQQACGTTARCSLGEITRNIVRAEGVGALWSGLRPTLMMSIPGAHAILHVVLAHPTPPSPKMQFSPVGGAEADTHEEHTGCVASQRQPPQLPPQTMSCRQN